MFPLKPDHGGLLWLMISDRMKDERKYRGTGKPELPVKGKP